MKREKEHLIHDLLGDDIGRSETLAAGAKILRRRRQWRAISPVLSILMVAAAGLWLIVPKHEQIDRLQVSEIKAAPTGQQAKALTDEELLALFPNTPVGLAKLPNGKKILIFPRPGDEQHFITRL